MICSENYKITVSIIIVNYNTVELILQCLKSIYANCNEIDFEIIVVDNASHDGSVEAISNNYPQVIIIENEKNVGFSKANNIAIKKSKGAFLLLLNSDTIVLPGAIKLLVEFLDSRSYVSAVGPKLLNADMTLQRSWFDFPSSIKTFCNITGISKLLYRLVNASCVLPAALLFKQPAFMITDVHEPMRVDYLVLACLLVRHDLIDIIGMLDENLFFYHEDCELGYRLNKHYLNTYYYPSAEIIHFGGSSSNINKLETYREYFKSLIYVMSKYGNILVAATIRAAIVSGMIIRLILSWVGMYRNIDKAGMYKNNSDLKSNSLRLHEINNVYFQIIKDCLR